MAIIAKIMELVSMYMAIYFSAFPHNFHKFMAIIFSLHKNGPVSNLAPGTDPGVSEKNRVVQRTADAQKIALDRALNAKHCLFQAKN